MSDKWTEFYARFDNLTQRTDAMLATNERNSYQEWTIVHHAGSAERTDKLRIQGGWLYRTRIWDKQDGASVALAFVPDHTSVTRAA